FAAGAKEQFKEETGTDFDEVDWQKYDPRQYDPRRVIREALSEPIEELESSIHEAKDTLQDTTDTAANSPVERPKLTQDELTAAARPIAQREQPADLPDPGRPEPAAEPPEPPVPPFDAEAT